MFIEVTKSLMVGFLSTIKLFTLTLVFSLPLGLILSLALISKRKYLRYPVELLIWIIRGTPLLLQLLVVYYGPGILLQMNIWKNGDSGRFLASLIAFVINYACYFAEIYRGGIQSVPEGQREAGKVLGLSQREIFIHIILLQSIKRILPPISNEVITLVKDTALARTIAVYEITWMGQTYIRSKGIVWPLFYTGVFYLLFNGLVTIIFSKLEKKLSYFKV